MRMQSVKCLYLPRYKTQACALARIFIFDMGSKNIWMSVFTNMGVTLSDTIYENRFQTFCLLQKVSRIQLTPELP
jgi:hypothetical protein